MSSKGEFSDAILKMFSEQAKVQQREVLVLKLVEKNVFYLNFYYETRLLFWLNGCF
jgi:hypothetical protein